MNGFSSSLSDDGHLYMGAPGAFYWHGQLQVTGLEDNYGNALPKEADPHGKDDDAYMGFAMAASGAAPKVDNPETGSDTGSFLATRRRREFVVVGQPKGNDLTGSVVVFDR